MERVLAKIIVGSQMFGTAEEGSDVDYAEIYCCDSDDLLGLTYKPNDDIHKDYRRYEIGKFIKMLMAANPNALEMLYAPEECLVQSSHEWRYLQSKAHMFLTTRIYDTFCGYARTQIKKARGLNKKVNWEKDKVTRKDVLDFCYVTPNHFSGSMPFKSYLGVKGLTQDNIGLAKIEHLRDGYNFYIGDDYGVVGSNSNEVRVCDIPKGEVTAGVFVFNRDAYSVHCRNYREYSQWLANRNELRYNTNKAHGQEMDSKNIQHNVRLLQTVKEALLTGTLKVKRSEEEAKYLLSIKHGEMDLEKLITFVEQEAQDIGELLYSTELPTEVDFEFCHRLLIKLRKWT